MLLWLNTQGEKLVCLRFSFETIEAIFFSLVSLHKIQPRHQSPNSFLRKEELFPLEFEERPWEGDEKISRHHMDKYQWFLHDVGAFSHERWMVVTLEKVVFTE